MNPSLYEYKTIRSFQIPLETSHLPNTINFNYNPCRLFLHEVQKYSKKCCLSALFLLSFI